MKFFRLISALCLAFCFSTKTFSGESAVAYARYRSLSPLRNAPPPPALGADAPMLRGPFTVLGRGQGYQSPAEDQQKKAKNAAARDELEKAANEAEALHQYAESRKLSAVVEMFNREAIGNKIDYIRSAPRDTDWMSLNRAIGSFITDFNTFASRKIEEHKRLVPLKGKMRSVRDRFALRKRALGIFRGAFKRSLGKHPDGSFPEGLKAACQKILDESEQLVQKIEGNAFWRFWLDPQGSAFSTEDSDQLVVLMKEFEYLMDRLHGPRRQLTRLINSPRRFYEDEEMVLDVQIKLMSGLLGREPQFEGLIGRKEREALEREDVEKRADQAKVDRGDNVMPRNRKGYLGALKTLNARLKAAYAMAEALRNELYDRLWGRG